MSFEPETIIEKIREYLANVEGPTIKKVEKNFDRWINIDSEGGLLEFLEELEDKL